MLNIKRSLRLSKLIFILPPFIGMILFAAKYSHELFTARKNVL